MRITIPTTSNEISKLNIGDKILISGTIYTGRDAALPQLVDLVRKNKFDLEGSAIMHTAFSSAGIAPTSSNKAEIESTIPFLSKSGVKIHIGKGMLSDNTIKELDKYNSIFAITPPLAALLTSKVKSSECINFENEGMEAMYKLEVENIPAIVGIAHGEKI